MKGNRLLGFIFSRRSDVFPFPGVGYSDNTHAWSILSTNICRSQWILHKQPSEKKEKNASSIPFFLFNLQFNLYISLYLSDQLFFSVTASSASTFYSCKWMITLPSHVGSMSSGKAETPRPYCPYTENSAPKLFLYVSVHPCKYLQG